MKEEQVIVRLCVLAVLATVFGFGQEKWQVTPSTPNQARYGWKTEYYLQTPERVFWVSVGADKVACNLTDTPPAKILSAVHPKWPGRINPRG